MKKIHAGQPPVIEKFYSYTSKKELFELNYRSTNGKLFSCIKTSERKCHDALNWWRSGRLYLKPGESFDKKLDGIIKMVKSELGQNDLKL